MFFFNKQAENNNDCFRDDWIDAIYRATQHHVLYDVRVLDLIGGGFHLEHNSQLAAAPKGRTLVPYNLKLKDIEKKHLREMSNFYLIQFSYCVIKELNSRWEKANTPKQQQQMQPEPTYDI